ncbi:Multiple inositol polyphosphate phosphatase 1 [Papilio machaon]|uniref:Multiple inositol polyphosphate phosphatase 1 n=1 Tax=Papilio machaon TaxID=76193 RepID=A0A194QTQ3_PAPMA|nr:Multiple inositol polyphosphate phosphatase 1 [Papilio machaon]
MLAGDLTSEGYISTQQLAQAWKNKYPGLLTDNPHDYLFKFGDDLRSSTSFRAFTEGLFKSQAGGNDVPKENDEKILRPYKFCNTWMNEVGDNNDTLVQKGTFESKQEYREMISNISKRLGFNYDVHRDVINSMYQMCRYDKAWNVAQISPWCAMISNISKRLGFNYDVHRDVINSMYQMCRYDKAWNVAQISPWCAVFTKEDLKRIEYAEDLETYYKYGYGNSLNEKMGCTTLKDMMDFLKNHVEHDTPQQPRAQIQFTEAATIMLTATAMGTRRDTTPLTGDNYHTPAVPTRQWTTSLMSPFSANIAAVLYKCTQDGNFQVKGEYQVLFLENEKPMKIEGCRVGLCDWNFVKNKFNEMTDNCDLQFCNNASYIKGYASIVLIVTFFATILNS